jgi:hypothetical protein
MVSPGLRAVLVQPWPQRARVDSGAALLPLAKGVLGNREAPRRASMIDGFPRSSSVLLGSLLRRVPPRAQLAPTTRAIGLPGLHHALNRGKGPPRPR